MVSTSKGRTDFEANFQVARDLLSTPSHRFTACPFSSKDYLLLEVSAFRK